MIIVSGTVITVTGTHFSKIVGPAQIEDLAVTLTDLHAYRKCGNEPSSTDETVVRFVSTRRLISRIVILIQGTPVLGLTGPIVALWSWLSRLLFLSTTSDNVCSSQRTLISEQMTYVARTGGHSPQLGEGLQRPTRTRHTKSARMAATVRQKCWAGTKEPCTRHRSSTASCLRPATPGT